VGGDTPGARRDARKCRRRSCSGAESLVELIGCPQ
jgi:hypothetical protein